MFDEDEGAEAHMKDAFGCVVIMCLGVVIVVAGALYLIVKHLL